MNTEPGRINNGIFGFGDTYEEASLILLPVPWDVTCSFKAGTSKGPQAILDASPQLDFFDKDYPDAYKKGIHMLPIDTTLLNKSAHLREKAAIQINKLESGLARSNEDLKELDTINQECDALRAHVKTQTTSILKDLKIPAVIGGDHSVILGSVQALSQSRNTPFGFISVDAHLDLRENYEGFTHSHACIMSHVLELPNITSFVQVGARDFADFEYEKAKNNDIYHLFTDDAIFEKKAAGDTWEQISNKLLEPLPQDVYVSIDIDGLTPDLCPNTGTPVPGGLSFNEVRYLLKKIVASNRRIIGFDIVETGPHDFDANVAARLLFLLSTLTLSR